MLGLVYLLPSVLGYLSCYDILTNGASVGDGVYTITVNNRNVTVRCDMTSGGWTRVINVPATATFRSIVEAVSEGNVVDTVFSKFADSDINLIGGLDPIYSIRIFEMVRYASRSGGWTSLYNQPGWMVDRDLDGANDCTATRGDQFIISDYTGAPLYAGADCNTAKHFVFGISTGTLGCYYAPRGWGAGSMWVRGSHTPPRPLSDSSVAFGGIRMKFLDYNKFDATWNDGGSNGNFDGAFFNPSISSLYLPENSGYFFVGSYGQNTYAQPINGYFVLLKNEGSELAVTPAVGYNEVFRDTGSGARLDGSFWRPICQTGYVAMGLISVRGYSPPNALLSPKIGCVLEKYTAPGTAGDKVYDDSGSGASASIGLWRTRIPDYMSQSQINSLVISPNTIIGYNSYTIGPGKYLPEMNLLVLPSVRTEKTVSFQPHLDALTYRDPPESFDPVATLQVVVPFFVVGQIDYRFPSVSAQVTKCPYYIVERLVMWTLTSAYVNDDQGNIYEEKALTVGSSREETTSIMHSVGVSQTTEGGVDLIGATASVTVSYQFSHTDTTSTSLFQQITTTRRYVIDSFSTLSEYSKSTLMNIRRGNGELVRTTAPIRSDQFARSTFTFDPLTRCNYPATRLQGNTASTTPMFTMTLPDHDRAQLQCDNLPLCTSYLVVAGFPGVVRFFNSAQYQNLATSSGSQSFDVFQKACGSGSQKYTPLGITQVDSVESSGIAKSSPSDSTVTLAVGSGCLSVCALAVVAFMTRRVARRSSLAEQDAMNSIQ